MKRTVKDTIHQYRQLYKVLAPDSASVGLSKDIWKKWEQDGVSPPDIDDIAAGYIKFENGFFYDIVTIAERLEKRKIEASYCAFCLDEYNFYAFSATDGYIVLVDDYFLQLLFVLSLIFVFDAQGLIEEKEKDEVRFILNEIIINNYFFRKRFDFEKETIVQRLLTRDYEMAEFTNYFFAALKTFIFSHEIGHHVLGHTRGPVNKTFGMVGNTVTIAVDDRRLADEFDADRYGYKLFREVSDTVDEQIYYAFCQYKFDFAPLFLFDLFEKLDDMAKRLYGKVPAYDTHPAPAARKKALEDHFYIDTGDPLYVSLKQSLNMLI